MKIITFFNNKGGVGKTTTVYHVAWMLSEMGYKTIAADIDPQSNLTAMFLPDERLENIYEGDGNLTLLDAITPIINGDTPRPVHIEVINENLGLIPGHLSLSSFEDTLSDEWLKCLDGKTYSFKVTSIFSFVFEEAAKQFNADIVLVDVGPNLGAINRAVTISSDFIVIPVASDLFSLQGIKNIGKTLNIWKRQWKDRLDRRPAGLNVKVPENQAKPIGYIVMQHSAKESRPVKSYLKWANRIPAIYNEFVLNETINKPITVEEDSNSIALLKHYRSLAPMSMEANKPIFLLKPADGAIGAHVYAVQKAYEEYRKLTEEILRRCDIS